MKPSNLRIALVQCAIYDLDIEANLKAVEREVERLAPEADLIVFPESITTGFSPEALRYAEEWGQGLAYNKLVALSQKHGVGLIASLFVKEGSEQYNRFILVDGDRVEHQDKRHLFALGGEPNMVRPAQERKVLTFRSWRIMPLVCYDLRFPVWTRCIANDYDLIVCVANWPSARREVWRTLLRARAMENLCYVVGVNRVGRDAMGLNYTGDSLAYNPRGGELLQLKEGEADSQIVCLEYQPLEDLRRKFPVWQDADSFVIRE